MVGEGKGCHIPQDASAGCPSPFVWPLST